MQRHNLWLKESLNDTPLEAGRTFGGRHLLSATTRHSDRGLDNAQAPIPLRFLPCAGTGHYTQFRSAFRRTHPSRSFQRQVKYVNLRVVLFAMTLWKTVTLLSDFGKCSRCIFCAAIRLRWQSRGGVTRWHFLHTAMLSSPENRFKL